ncbi:ubiquitin-conjugating enzyme/RWD-like protein [Polychytrium aggregatum]|uniref:ubiquitin-conjugating enzyme/RWD-like protein n=1 Tax=Polychytrium aggregatum TaxID=110093 RepID=UPI0022FE0424|nr:ubiquitin-conjugating enzyme/RWD-like protein [Polychytrium aggregatum]KAI9204317.1 ubiquitin-conjugating enzyme/RWD-like protein [Polychytrium aggregatum]
MSAHALRKQYRELVNNPVAGFTVSLQDDSIYKWKVGMVGPPDTPYSGGFFWATMKFPEDFPFKPPTFSFDKPLYHPNIYGDGRLCISILHPPGDDPMSGELAAERWNPTQTVESILLSVISLLGDPNCSSPANVDAAVMFRERPEEYKKMVLSQVQASRADIPEDLYIPGWDESHSHTRGASGASEDDAESEDFWYDDNEDEADEDEDEGDDDDQNNEWEEQADDDDDAQGTCEEDDN